MFINEDDYITTLELFDPETRRNETITTTPEHPFYVSSKEKEPWTGAGELEVDDEIRKADGNVGIVLFVRTKLQKKTMYNLSVSDNHNFFVGDQGWLTHNCSLPKFTQPGWIKKDLYSELSGMVDKGKLSPETLKKFEEALEGFASGQGGMGIKKLASNGIKIGSVSYQYELKILGNGGAARIYGNMNDKGQIIFEKLMKGH